MGLPIFVFPNRADVATLSAGSWQSTLPLTNLQDRRLAKVARSTTDSTADAQFQIDLGATQWVRAASIHGHNLSLAATYRFRGYSAAPPSGLVYDTGFLEVFPEIYPTGVLAAGNDGFSDRKLSQAQYDAGHRVDIIHVLTVPQTRRYWTWEFSDTSNPDGYVQIGRTFLGYGWEPLAQFDVGATLGWETSSRRTETDGGAAFFQDRPRRRVAEVKIGNISTDEALTFAHDMQRYLGTTTQALVVMDQADTVHMHRRAFLATLQRPNPLRFTRSAWNEQTFSLIEDI